MNEFASKSTHEFLTDTTSSPDSRKTRTIYVARAIHEEETEGIAGQNAAVNQSHSRDPRSGKLTSYAALGGAQDVERFDQFLAQQRGHLSASELRAAAASSDQKMLSTKQQTMRRMQLERECEATEDSGTRNVDEIDNVVQKRREETVAHRKWLQSLPINERVNQQRQQNALRKWRQINNEWETFKKKAARRLNKNPQELVISRASAYREQREMYDALQKARPLRDKVGADLWLVSLRDEGTRFVPVGNIFSGLYCPIRENSKLGPSVRRPLDNYYNSDTSEHDESRLLSKLEKRSLELLAKKKWRLRKQLELLLPHEVQSSADSNLAVETMELFAWASGSGVDGDDDEFDYSLSNKEEQIASQQHQLHSRANASSSDVINETESDNNEFDGPSLRITYASDDDAGDYVMKSNGDSFEGRHLPLRLSFFTPVGEQDQRSLKIYNDGNTIVHYQWWRVPFKDETDELMSHLRGQRTRREEQEFEQLITISVSKHGGTLLPGDTQLFVFTFNSLQAGMYLAKWLLDVDPQPQIRFRPRSIDPVTDLSEPVEVHLSCVAIDKFSARRQRAIQLTRIQQLEGRVIVASLVDEILECVRLPKPMDFHDMMPRDDMKEFYDKNGSHEFGDVYYSPAFVRDCRALYERAQAIVSALIPSKQVTIVNSDSTNQNAADDITINVEKSALITALEQPSSAERAITEATLQIECAPNAYPQTPHAQEWNWCLKELAQLCVMADETQHRHLSYLKHRLENEFDDLDEDDDDEDDGEDEEATNKADQELEDSKEKDHKNGGLIDEKRTPYEVRRAEKFARRQALEDEISAYKPDLQITFEMLRYSACTTPYQNTRLHQRLRERIASLCSELPVVCEIAKMMNPGDEASLYAAKVEGVGKLLVRGLDEAIGDNLDHQVLIEIERRRVQKMWLKDKASYSSIGLNKAAGSTTAAAGSEDPRQALEPTAVDHSGVIIMQVDLDLAAWYSLIITEAEEAVASADGPLSLSWQLSPALVQQETFVPAKVREAADAIQNVLNTLSSGYPNAHTVVLVSELNRPPLTRHTYNLLCRVSQAGVKAKELRQAQKIETNSIQLLTNQDEQVTKADMACILDRLLLRLSLRDVAPILQRTTGKVVTFCASVDELLHQCQNHVLESVTVPIDDELLGGIIKVDGVAQRAKETPRILLLEHLEAAGIKMVIPASQKEDELVKNPTTLTPPKTQKHVVGGNKRSDAVTLKGKIATPSAPASVNPAIASTPSICDLLNPESAGENIKKQGLEALRNEFMRIGSVCVMDCLPSIMYESAFAFTARQNDTQTTPRIFAGPTLCQEIERWHQTLQPTDPDIAINKIFRMHTAVVGGKSLETKLRLIDGLLEFVQEIYFVGEVAMSLYRVLHLKEMKISATCDVDGMKDGEEDEKVEEQNKLLSETSLEKESEKAPFETRTGKACSLWNLLVPAVEKIQKKANRKCVRLMLPIDWIVGETYLEEQDKSHDIENDEAEEEEEASQWEDRLRQRMSQKIEPDHLDIFEQKRQYVFDGERAHVVLGHASLRDEALSDIGWQTFQDVTTSCFADVKVVNGKSSILTSCCSDSEGDDVESRNNTAALYDWTFRAFDVGPIAMQALARYFHQDEKWDCQDPTSAISKALIVNGVCGAVEYHEFCTATKQLLKMLLDYDPQNVFVAGNGTASWFQHIESKLFACTSTDMNESNEDESMHVDLTNSNENLSLPACVRKVVNDRVVRNARALKRLIEVRPHPSLVNLASHEFLAS
ncbi:putative MYCBP-associated protein [Plasmopara halstedii]